MDMALTQTPSGKFDIAVNSYDAEHDDGLRTSVILSLFVDTRAHADDVLDDDDKRGYWASPTLGSRLWLLRRRKQIPDVLRAAQDYATEALQWLIDDGVAKDVLAEASWLRRGVLLLRIGIIKANGGQANYQFEQIWEQSL